MLPTTAITDLEIDSPYLESWTIAFGGNNVFNVKPKTQGFLTPDTDGNGKGLNQGNGSVDNPNLNGAYNPNGGFYYARLTLKF